MKPEPKQKTEKKFDRTLLELTQWDDEHESDLKRLGFSEEEIDYRKLMLEGRAAKTNLINQNLTGGKKNR